MVAGSDQCLQAAFGMPAEHRGIIPPIHDGKAD